jgi:hypothetical protein
MAERHDDQITEEMISTFARGLQLVAESHDETDEYRQIDKKLRSLLFWQPEAVSLSSHCVSPLDPMLDAPMPRYLERLAAGRDWGLSKQWRRVLQAALEARGR